MRAAAHRGEGSIIALAACGEVGAAPLIGKGAPGPRQRFLAQQRV